MSPEHLSQEEFRAKDLAVEAARRRQHWKDVYASLKFYLHDPPDF